MKAKAGAAAKASRRGVGLAVTVLILLMFSKSAYSASLGSYYTFYVMGKFHVALQTSQALLFLFLLVPGVVSKLLIMAALSAATAPWYPLLQARLYRSLPGRSPVAVTLSSAAGLAGGLGPLAVGLIAERAGLPWALGVLAVVPVVILVLGRAPREPGGQDRQESIASSHR